MGKLKEKAEDKAAAAVAAATKSLQSCPTLCDPIDSCPPGFASPWDSPGENIGVVCHYLLPCQRMGEHK